MKWIGLFVGTAVILAVCFYSYLGSCFRGLFRGSEMDGQNTKVEKTRGQKGD